VLCALRGRAGLADFAEMTPSGGTAPSYPSKTVPFGNRPAPGGRGRFLHFSTTRTRPLWLSARFAQAAGEDYDRGAILASGPTPGLNGRSADGGIADTTCQ
jgi:hypothetical protein